MKINSTDLSSGLCKLYSKTRGENGEKEREGGIEGERGTAGLVREELKNILHMLEVKVQSPVALGATTSST